MFNNKNFMIMKKVFKILCVVMAMLVTVFAISSFTIAKDNANAIKVVLSGNDFIIKQTLEFSSRKPVVIYYKKDANGYSAWSETNLQKQDPSQLSDMTGFFVEEVSEVKGDCYFKAKTVDEIVSTAMFLYDNYGHFVKF